MWRRLSCGYCLAGIVLGLLCVPTNCPAQGWFSAADAAAEREQQQLERVLTERGSIDFLQLRLRDAVDTLAEQFHLPIKLSNKKLDEASVSPDTPITARLENLPLESILRVILKDLELTFVIREEMIQITTPEDAESQLELRVYPVLDLVVERAIDPRDGVMKEYADYDSLIEVIISSVKPDSWNDVGGPGPVDSFANAGVLVIAQTREVHNQIQGLLQALRRAKVFQGLASAPLPTVVNRSMWPPSTLSPTAGTIATPTAAWQLPRVYAADR